MRKRIASLWAVPVWLLLWAAVSRVVGQEILLASPWKVLTTFLSFLSREDFWRAMCFSGIRILAGFLLAMLLGTALGAAGSRVRWVRELLSPVVTAIKAVPVASFIILVLVWFSSRSLSVLISFLIGFPVFYANIMSGMNHLDEKLAEMAQVFRVPLVRRIRYIVGPQLLPSFATACTTALGLCWKSGIAAEVIGIPKGSVGEKMYQAKIYLETPELLAWTLAIVLGTFAMEKILEGLLKLQEKRMVKGND